MTSGPGKFGWRRKLSRSESGARNPASICTRIPHLMGRKRTCFCDSDNRTNKSIRFQAVPISWNSIFLHWIATRGSQSTESIRFAIFSTHVIGLFFFRASDFEAKRMNRFGWCRKVFFRHHFRPEPIRFASWSRADSFCSNALLNDYWMILNEIKL